MAVYAAPSAKQVTAKHRVTDELTAAGCCRDCVDAVDAEARWGLEVAWRLDGAAQRRDGAAAAGPAEELWCHCRIPAMALEGGLVGVKSGPRILSDGLVYQKDDSRVPVIVAAYSFQIEVTAGRNIQEFSNFS